MSNIVNLDDYRKIEDILKLRLGAKSVIFCAELENGDIATYVPHELLDITLVYMIQTIKDRRTARLQE
jgi:hypothetical protein